MPVPGQVEQNRFRLAAFLAAQRLVDGGANGMAGFRRGNDPFGMGEHDAGFKRCQLRHGHGFNQLFVIQL